MGQVQQGTQENSRLYVGRYCLVKHTFPGASQEAVRNLPGIQKLLWLLYHPRTVPTMLDTLDK